MFSIRVTTPLVQAAVSGVLSTEGIRGASGPWWCIHYWSDLMKKRVPSGSRFVRCGITRCTLFPFSPPGFYRF